MQDILDLREIDLKLGPISKWDREKLLVKSHSHSIASRVAIRQGEMEQLVECIYPESGKRYNTNHVDIQYVKEKNFGQPIYSHPHPSNHESSESDYTKQWKKYYESKCAIRGA